MKTKILKKISHLNEINILLAVIFAILTVENLFNNPYVEHLYFLLIAFVIVNLLSLYLCKEKIKKLTIKHFIEQEREKSKHYNSFVESYYGKV